MPVIGTQQSPIRIFPSTTLPLLDPQWLFHFENYLSWPIVRGYVEGDPDHANFIIDPPADIRVNFRGEVYTLRRIHLHHCAEHIIDHTPLPNHTDKWEYPYDFEVHLVHGKLNQSLDAGKLVVGILYEESADKQNQAFTQFAEAISRKKSTYDNQKHSCRKPEQICAKINLLDFFPTNCNGEIDFCNWYHYEGSLTSEPYGEDVSWIVMRDLGFVNTTENDRLQDLIQHHARSPRALDRRIVVRSFR